MALSDVGANLATSLLEQTGSEWTYKRGPLCETVRFYKSEGAPVAIENGGQVTEQIIVTFRGLTSSLAAFGPPQSGDSVSNGTSIYTVRPLIDKCYHTVGGMIHINAKQVG